MRVRLFVCICVFGCLFVRLVVCLDGGLGVIDFLFLCSLVSLFLCFYAFVVIGSVFAWRVVCRCFCCCVVLAHLFLVCLLICFFCSRTICGYLFVRRFVCLFVCMVGCLSSLLFVVFGVFVSLSVCQLDFLFACSFVGFVVCRRVCARLFAVFVVCVSCLVSLFFSVACLCVCLLLWLWLSLCFSPRLCVRPCLCRRVRFACSFVPRFFACRSFCLFVAFARNLA